VTGLTTVVESWSHEERKSFSIIETTQDNEWPFWFANRN